MRRCGRWSVTSSGWKGCIPTEAEAGEYSADRRRRPHRGGVATLPTRPFRDRVRIADDTGVASLWSTRVYGGVLLRVLSKAGTDGPCELLEVALAPEVLPRLRRAGVGCMLVVARMP